jgi:hypothetical protein
MPEDRSETEAEARERGRAVSSGHANSRSRGEGNPLNTSSKDDDPGGWNGGHDQGEERATEADDPSLTGWSGDSVRTQGLQSATSSSLGSQTAGTTSGRKSDPAPEPRGFGDGDG